MSGKITQFNKKDSDLYTKISPETLLKIHSLMVLNRVLEERLIKMVKVGQGYFWIGGPGEEAFNVPLGMQGQLGEGIDYDYWHLHYRSSGIVLGMGGTTIDTLRQMRNVATDPYSGGRNFVNHYSIPKWNIVPISPTIETQYSTCIGTALAQKRSSKKSITIVNGGDAGTAEGDFHTCLVWANRPINPLPLLIIVTNNGYGISTEMAGQHGEKKISNWAAAFPGMPGKTINGNDPVESYFAIQEAMNYCRKERKPYLLEVKASRLYGHSSASGANRLDELDCISVFEEALEKRDILSKEKAQKVWKAAKERIDEEYETVKKEPFPENESVWEHVFSSGLPDDYPKKGGS